MGCILHNKANALLALGKLELAQDCLQVVGSLGDVPENTRRNMAFIDAIRRIDSRPVVDTDGALKRNGLLSFSGPTRCIDRRFGTFEEFCAQDNFGNVGSKGGPQMEGGKGGEGEAGSRSPSRLTVGIR